MANTAATSPGTMGNGTGNVWTNPDNAKVSDSAYATRALQNAGITAYLNATNFGFAIPSGATIDGILAEVERYADGPNSWDARDFSIILLIGGVASGTNLSAGETWSGTKSYISFGSSAELWGLTPSVAEINASNFGLTIRAQLDPARERAGNSTVYVDHIRLTIYYTEGGGVTESSWYAIAQQ